MFCYNCCITLLFRGFKFLLLCMKSLKLLNCKRNSTFIYIEIEQNLIAHH
jgi:hypothetical protein